MPPAHYFGDRDDDPTVPTTRQAILAQLVESLRTHVASLGKAIQILDSIEGSDREYLVAALAEECAELSDAARDLGPALRTAYPR